MPTTLNMKEIEATATTNHEVSIVEKEVPSKLKSDSINILKSPTITEGISKFYVKSLPRTREKNVILSPIKTVSIFRTKTEEGKIAFMIHAL
ncbi:hypothetical protein AHAS_Ahas19G0161400 [Arachis hypogaea]